MASALSELDRSFTCSKEMDMSNANSTSRDAGYPLNFSGRLTRCRWAPPPPVARSTSCRSVTAMAPTVKASRGSPVTLAVSPAGRGEAGLLSRSAAPCNAPSAAVPPASPCPSARLAASSVGPLPGLAGCSVLACTCAPGAAPCVPPVNAASIRFSNCVNCSAAACLCSDISALTADNSVCTATTAASATSLLNSSLFAASSSAPDSSASSLACSAASAILFTAKTGLGELTRQEESGGVGRHAPRERRE